MNSQKKSKKNFKNITSAFTISLFTLTQVFSVSSIAFAEPEVASSPVTLQGPVLTLNQANKIIKTPTKTDTSTTIGFLTQVNALSKATGTTTVASLPKKAEDTNDSKVSYNVENGKLVLYTYLAPKKYERRELDLGNLKIKSNSDLSNVQIKDTKNLSFEALSKKYATKIDDQGIVRLNLIKAVTHDFQFEINDDFKVKVYEDQSYEVTIRGKNYISENGEVIAPNVGHLKLNFINGQPVSIVFLGAKPRFSEAFFEVNGTRAHMTRLDYFEVIQGKEASRAVQYLSSEASKKIVFDSGFFFLDIVHNQELVFVIFIYDYQKLNVIRHYSNGNYYSIAVQGDWDITEEKVAALQEKTTQSLRSLIKDDTLVRLGEVKASDGLSFEAKVSEGKLLFNILKGDGSVLCFNGSPNPCLAHQNDQGKWTLTVPQSDGTKKVYDVKIDDQGQINLIQRIDFNDVKNFGIKDTQVVSWNRSWRYIIQGSGSYSNHLYFSVILQKYDRGYWRTVDISQVSSEPSSDKIYLRNSDIGTYEVIINEDNSTSLIRRP